jgi:hypothetical protein
MGHVLFPFLALVVLYLSYWSSRELGVSFRFVTLRFAVVELPSSQILLR